MLYYIQNKIEPLGRPKHVFSAHFHHNPDISESVSTGARRRLAMTVGQTEPIAIA